MTIDTDKLTELLQACTPLPWGTDPHTQDVLIGAYDDGPDAIYVGEVDRKADTAAIVAVMNAAPELIERLQRAEGYGTLNIPAMLQERDELRARVKELESRHANEADRQVALSKVAQERDRLQAELDALRGSRVDIHSAKPWEQDNG
jgi:hypothetical protein